MERLLEDFAALDLKAWRQEVERLLKGASFEKRMFTETLDGLTVKPIYTAADTAGPGGHPPDPGVFPFIRGSEAPGAPARTWEVAQELPITDPAEFNRAVCDDLEHGQTAVNLVLDQSACAGNGGTEVTGPADLARALAGVDLAAVPLYIDTGPAVATVGEWLDSHCRQAGFDSAELRGALAFDPLAELARRGRVPGGLERAWPGLARLTRLAGEWGATGLRTVAVRGDVWHEAGASAAEELALALASGVEALRCLEVEGLDPKTVAARSWFVFSTGTDFFTEIAKFRAARRLWARVLESCGVASPEAGLVLHARSSGWSQSALDPHTNILRATTQAFAAIAGGCGSLHLDPFDRCTGQRGELARRLARNTQLVLRDEANFHRVADPAGGSWYVESLTRELADRAWGLFQELEREGGMARALRAGSPQRMAAATMVKRRERLAHRRDVLVGTNRYPLAEEAPPAPWEGTSVFTTGGEVEPIPALRGAEPFEALRSRVTADGPPRVLLAAMGRPAGYMARLEFTRSFYQVGGFRVDGERHFESTDEVVAALAGDPPAAVCIVSRDDAHAGLVPGLATGLLAAVPDLVIHLAGGNDGEWPGYRDTGVGERITLRSNVLDVLSRLAEVAS